MHVTNSPFEINLIDVGGEQDKFFHGWPHPNGNFLLGASRFLFVTPDEAETVGKALVGWAEEARKADDPAYRNAQALESAGVKGFIDGVPTFYAQKITDAGYRLVKDEA